MIKLCDFESKFDPKQLCGSSSKTTLLSLFILTFSETASIFFLN